MSHQIWIESRREGNPTGTIDVVAEGPSQQPQLFPGIQPPVPLRADSPFEVIYITVLDGGYWILKFNKPSGRLTQIVPRLPQGPRGWWHELHCPNGAGADKTIKIGVIDEALPHQEPGSSLAHVVNLGGAAWKGPVNKNRAFQSLGNHHGLAVCSLLTARPAHPDGFEGIAPNATVYFCAAGSDTDERLNPTRLANCIDLLASPDYECDIITFSSGDGDRPLPNIEIAMEAAADRGTLCFAAAGNKGGSPRFPAKYPDCLAVAALGRAGLAPKNTQEEEDERLSTSLPNGLFFWHASAQGPGVEFLGAGVAVFRTEPSGGTFAMTGTSAAAPIVAGTAALILGEDATYQSLGRTRERVNHAMTALRANCQNLSAGAQMGPLVAP